MIKTKNQKKNEPAQAEYPERSQMCLIYIHIFDNAIAKQKNHQKFGGWPLYILFLGGLEVELLANKCYEQLRESHEETNEHLPFFQFQIHDRLKMEGSFE